MGVSPRSVVGHLHLWPMASFTTRSSRFHSSTRVCVRAATSLWARQEPWWQDVPRCPHRAGCGCSRCRAPQAPLGWELGGYRPRAGSGTAPGEAAFRQSHSKGTSLQVRGLTWLPAAELCPAPSQLPMWDGDV